MLENHNKGKSLSNFEIQKGILSYAKKDIRIKVDKNKLRLLDIPLFIGDNKKMRSIGWKREFNIDDSIKDVLEYWRKKKAGIT